MSVTFGSFAELLEAGLLPACDMHEEEHDPRSAVTHGMQVQALRDRLTNMLALLYTTAVRPIALETEGDWSITGEPEEVLRTYAQKPALLPTRMLEGIRKWEAEHGHLFFGRTWTSRPIRRIPCGVYPTSIDGRELVIAEDGHVLSIIGVPGYEDVQLNPMLKRGAFRWMSPNFPIDSYTTKYFFAAALEDRTMFWHVAEHRAQDFRQYAEKHNLNLVQWSKAHEDGMELDHKVEFHWRLASCPQLIDSDDLAALPDVLEELQDMLEVRTLDVETGMVVKVGSARDVELSPELPLELTPSGTCVPLVPTLDPYDVHMYKTEEKRTLRENTEPREQLHARFVWNPRLETFESDDLQSKWIKVHDYSYPEIDASEETIPHIGGLFPDTDEYDPRFVPAYAYRVRDEDYSDKISVNITRVELHWPNSIKVRKLGFNRHQRPEKWFFFWRQRWKKDGRKGGTSWTDFHDALAWLVRHRQFKLTGFEHDRRIKHAQVKPAGVEQFEGMPKWAIDQKLWINWTPMGTKARIFGVPVMEPKLMRGKPLAVYQVGYITHDDEVVWGLAQKPVPIQRYWLKGELKLNRELAHEIGLDITNKGVPWDHVTLKVNIMNELPVRAHRAMQQKRVVNRPMEEDDEGS